MNGFRNCHLRHLLHGPSHDRVILRRQAAAITRKLALLRAHGLIKKVTGTHRWILTENGRTIITALLTARLASVDQLTQMAA